MALPVNAIKKNFDARHNIPAFSDTHIDSAAAFVPVINFLPRSRISHAITAQVEVCWEHLIQFWNNARYETIDEVPKIITSFNMNSVVRDLRVTEALVREVLQFGENGDERFQFPKTLVIGFFQ